MHNDKYRSLDELKALEPAGAWSQHSRDPKRSWLTVAAPHGGCIEPFTREIAIKIAGDDYKLFVFEGRLGLNQDCYARLHVTSTNFRDSVLTKLQEGSKMTLAIHGASNGKDDADPRITWIGGRQNAMRKLIENRLLAEGFAAKQALKGHPYAGEDRQNFVNVVHDGVQLELSFAERAALRQDGLRLSAYVNAVRSALSEFENEDV